MTTATAPTTSASRTDVSATSANRTDLALLLIRLMVGGSFCAHGAQKLFVFGIAGITKGFTQFGVPLPAITAPLVTFVELFAGIALIIGLLTRLAAFGLAIDMLGAMAFVHFKNGFFLPTGYEYALTLLVICLAIMTAGPGRYSLDANIAARRGR